MKTTTHKILGRRVLLAQGGWFVVKKWAYLSSTKGRDRHAHRERTLWQLERSMRGLPK